MRHQKDGRQFGRNTSHRRAMFRALTANLVLHERIETTDAKAKELRRFAERVITRARRLGEVAYTPHDKLSAADRARRLAAKRQVAQFLQHYGVKGGTGETKEVDLIEKVFVDLARRFKARAGGYTRIIKLGSRRGDNAPMSLIEFVEGEAVPETSDKGEKTVPAATVKSTAKAAPKAAAPKAAAPKAAAPKAAAPKAAAKKKTDEDKSE